MRSLTICLSFLALSTAGCGGCSKPSGANESPDAAPPPSHSGSTFVSDGGVLNVTPVPMASVVRAVNRENLPAYNGPTGSVEGVIRITGAPSPATPADFHKCPDAEKTYGHATREEEGTAPNAPRWIADAVVAVTEYKGFFVPEKDEAELLTIEGCAFTRRTVTMTYGQRLDVKNNSKEYWTPKLDPPQGIVTMMATPGGEAVKIYPKQFGRFLLVDHDRKYTQTDLFVFLHPLHTTSGIGGKYRIDGVPVGRRKVNVTHPQVGNFQSSTEVEVKANEVAHADLTIVRLAPTDAGAAPATPPAGAGLH